MFGTHGLVHWLQGSAEAARQRDDLPAIGAIAQLLRSQRPLDEEHTARLGVAPRAVDLGLGFEELVVTGGVLAEIMGDNVGELACLEEANRVFDQPLLQEVYANSGSAVLKLLYEGLAGPDVARLRPPS